MNNIDVMPGEEPDDPKGNEVLSMPGSLGNSSK
jgi:hypothetical protein